MDLFSMLPLLSGWSYVRLNGSDTLEAGEVKTLYESEGDESAWLLGAVFHSNVGDAELQVNIYTPGGQQITYNLNPAGLLDRGFISPNRVSPYVAVYDDTNNTYEAIFQPGEALPVSGQLTVSLIGGSLQGEATYDVQIIRIADMSAIVDSIQQVLGIAGIESLIRKPKLGPPTTVEGISYSGFEP